MGSGFSFPLDLLAESTADIDFSETGVRFLVSFAAATPVDLIPAPPRSFGRRIDDVDIVEVGFCGLLGGICVYSLFVFGFGENWMREMGE